MNAALRASYATAVSLICLLSANCSTSGACDGPGCCTTETAVNVTVRRAFFQGYQVQEPCVRWIIFINCWRTRYRLAYRMVTVEQMVNVTSCCSGYTAVGSDCIPESYSTIHPSEHSTIILPTTSRSTEELPTTSHKQVQNNGSDLIKADHSKSFYTTEGLGQRSSTDGPEQSSSLNLLLASTAEPPDDTVDGPRQSSTMIPISTHSNLQEQYRDGLTSLDLLIAQAEPLPTFIPQAYPSSGGSSTQVDFAFLASTLLILAMVS